MKTFHGIGLGAVATVLSAGLWLGCSSDDTTSSGTPADAGGSDSTVAEGGREAGATGDTGTVEAAVDAGTVVPEAGASETGAPETGTTEAAAGDAADETTIATDAAVEASDGAVEAAAPTCTAYCAAIQANCTGADMQYQSTAECMKACALTPVGTGVTGDTLGCRAYHAGLALAAPNPHCWHAGPYGFGVCGDECASFCRLAVGYCSPAGGFDAGPPPYASLGECTTACAGFARVADNDGGPFVVTADGGVDGAAGYSAGGPTGGNTLDCREYHLGVALGGGAAQVTHCPHPAAVSATCN